jgi:hypothetical protein
MRAQLIFNDGALFLNDEDLVEPIGEPVECFRHHRPQQPDLAEAQTRRFRVDPELFQSAG